MQTKLLSAGTLALLLTVSPLALAQDDDQPGSNGSNNGQDQAGETQSDDAKQGMDSNDGKAMEDNASGGGSMEAASRGGDYIGQQRSGEMLSGNLVGVAVVNPKDEELGDIQNVIIDPKRGIRGLVIGVGGFLGIGTKLVAVPYDRVEQGRDEGNDLTLRLDTTTEQLQNAPAFKTLAQAKAEAKAKAIEEAMKAKAEREERKAQERQDQKTATENAGG